MNNKISSEINVKSASYIGKPIDNTVMFITKKVENLLGNLRLAENCLVFCEDTIVIPEDMLKKHTFRKSQNPQQDYARFVQVIADENERKNLNRQYKLNKGGYYVGENVQIGIDTLIEPMCFIGHDVIIGNHARILTGSKVKNAIIGDYFIANENSTIGTQGFTMTLDESGNRIRIPSLGKVLIGNHVEIGMHANIAVGSAGDTVIEDYVKIDSFVHIAHDSVIKRNVEIPSGVIIGGFVTIEENAFIGINATLRNRITIGKDAMVGMGSVVTKSVPPETTVVGNPAKPLVKT